MEAYINYFANNGDTYLAALFEHIWITLLSVFVACAIAVPLGILSVRFRRVKPFITGTFSTLRIVPSLAILLLCIPIIGTGVRSAVVSLTVLAIPPILINTTLAFDTLPVAVLETALGMGMSSRRIFWTVKFPLAMPLIMTGVRTAVVEVIASATLAAYIGAGGLGTIIFTGLGLMRTDLLLIGGVSVAAVSLLSGFLLSRLEAGMFRYRGAN